MFTIKHGWKQKVLYLVAIFILLVQIYPLFWVLMSSFKTAEEFRMSSLGLPSFFDVDNYRAAVASGYLPRYFLNSTIVTSFSVLLIVYISGMAAFAIQKMSFGFNKKMLSFFLFGILVPIQIALIPLFIMFNKSGLSSTYFSLIFANVGFSLPIAIFLFVSFLEFLPNEILESAVIDGCSVTRMFFRIVMPLSANVIITLVVLYGVHTWNEFIFAFTFTSRRDMYTVTVGLRDFFGRYGNVNWTVCFAAIVTTTFPTLLIYFIFNRSMIAGMTAGAVKG